MTGQAILRYRAQGPVLQAYLDCGDFVEVIRGPLGSGKTTCSAAKMFRIICTQRATKEGIRKSRVACIRNTYPDLKNTTIRDWKTIIPDNCGRFTMGVPPEHKLDFDLPDGTRVQSEVIFLALDRPDDVRKLRGMQLSHAWINEGKEVPKAILDMITGRVDRYPMPGWAPPQIIMDTNAWDEDHWLQTLNKAADAGELPGYKFFTQPPAVIKVDRQWVVNPDAENLAVLKPDYYQRQIAGKREDWIKVNLANEIGLSFDGKPVHPDYQESIHVAKDLLRPAPGIVYVGMDFGLCYSDDTEVLTEQGWKLFRDVDEHVDRVATLNPQGFGLEYTDINFKVEFDYSGNLIQFKGQNFDFMVTPEHRTPFTHRDTPDVLHFASAEELAEKATAHRFVQLHANWAGSSEKIFGLPAEMAAEFLGWYVSEGSTEKVNNSYRVSIAQTKTAPTLDALMSRPEWGMVTWRKSPNGWRATVPQALGEQLRSLGNAWVKHVPKEIKAASPQVIRAFIDAYVKGDGHVRTKAKANSGLGRKARNEIVAATVSRRLADDLQELALKAGLCATVRRQKAQVSKMADGREIHSSGIFVISFKSYSRAEILPHQVSRVPYKGKIYCLNVPYHTLYVRRNGRPCWNGNTPAATFWQRQADRQWWGVGEVVCTDTGAVRFADALKAKCAEMKAQVTGLTFVFKGDPSGDDRRDTDERTYLQVLRANGIPAQACSTNDAQIRRDALDRPLQRSLSGKPGILLSPCMKMLRRGLAGAWCYQRLEVAGEERFKDVPDKGPYSHVCESAEYGLMDAGEHAMVNSPGSSGFPKQPIIARKDWDPRD